MFVLEDMNGKKFTEGDYLLFADGDGRLRVALVHGIKSAGGGSNYRIALEIVEGRLVKKKRYSRDYRAGDFYKLNPANLTGSSE